MNDNTLRQRQNSPVDRKSVQITVDGRPLSADPGRTLLEVLQEQEIEVPSMCFNPVFAGQGHCGLCVVEISADGAFRPRHACLVYPDDGLEVRTSSDEVRRLRAHAARLLLRHRPFARPETEEKLRELIGEGSGRGAAEADGISGADSADPGCIRCGLCVSVCQKVGKGILTFLGRGKSLRVGMVVPAEGNDACGHCRACQRVCPTGFIRPDARSAFTARLYR